MITLVVADLQSFIVGAFLPFGMEGERTLNSNVELNDFKALFTSEAIFLQSSGTRLLLNSFVDERSTISTSPDIVGVYICQGENEFGPPQQETVVITLQGNKQLLVALNYTDFYVPSEINTDDSSVIYIRASFENSVIDVINTDYRLAVFNSRVS